MGYYYTEEDPLLPRDTRAPEIHGSRPQSIKEGYVSAETTNQLSNDGNADELYVGRPNYLNHSVFLIIFLCIFSLGLWSVPNFKDIFGDRKPGPQTIEQRVNKILTDTPLIDGHNDLAILIRFLYNNQIYDRNFTKPFEEGGMSAQVDLPRLREGRNGGAFWSAFVPCPSNGSDFSDENYAEAVAFTLSQIDVLTRLRAAYPAHFSLPPNSSTALSAFKAGQLISPLAIEGLHQIGNSISNLRHYHSLGVRYATLTHNCHNSYADAALVEDANGHSVASKPLHGGVSKAGRELIHEMNRIGMIVDLAHVSQDTMRDVLGGSPEWDGSLAPPIYSHSSAHAICPHPRNVPDDILQLVKKKQSLVMVNFSPDFVSCTANGSPSGIPDFYPNNSTLKQVVRHIRHIGEEIGYDFVGLGSDFDGIPSTPEGLEDVSKFPDLVAELLKQGVSDGDAGKIVGGNLLRVWGEVDRVAEKLQKKGEKPLEDKLPSLLPEEFGA
ncbi:Dipeptidase sirJ [Lachnellula cervina]|uniref:Dipeptidase n=1 Tax=Lachnellula cervina TaxID=1316786 RepID=A0A7D8UTX4_9HELO|nr:Dipeptidase sirJ [Lachnellula cervina]